MQEHDGGSTPDEGLGFDPVALRARYRAERDKRLRPDAVDQFVRLGDQLAGERTDPYVEPGFTREPLTDEVDIVMVGGGFSGLLLGAHLRRVGVTDGLRFVERGGDFGGTWYWNRYPGAACDTASTIYLPMLEELGYLPSRRYAPAPEIFEHCRRIAHTFDLYRDACFQTEVTGLRWDEDAARWIVRTNRGDAMRAQFVIVSPGPMDRPKLAGIPGIESFKGHSFHTSRWDYDYTGGTADGGLDRLGDRTVGIIGTGATAVQCIPHLAAAAEHLYVFQRTPSAVDARDNAALDPSWVGQLQPGWQQKLIDNFTTLTSGGPVDEDLLQDGWTAVARNLRQLMARRTERGEPIDDLAWLVQLADFQTMEHIRSRIDDVIADPATAEALKPWYDRFCKRPCFHDEYLPVFNRPNVTLVDTGGRGVERITATGVVVAGREYPVDCLVHGTGFEVGAPLAKRLGFEVTGRGGATLLDRWATGAQTHHGIIAHGFPNLFFMSHVQFGFSLNFTHFIGEQAKHIAYILGHARAAGLRTVEPTAAAQAAWVAEVDRAARDQRAFQTECTPSYFNAEGDLARLNARNSPYGGSPTAFFGMLAEWRADGGLPGLELTA